jgi:hypothetical protein
MWGFLCSLFDITWTRFFLSYKENFILVCSSDSKSRSHIWWWLSWQTQSWGGSRHYMLRNRVWVYYLVVFLPSYRTTIIKSCGPHLNDFIHSQLLPKDPINTTVRWSFCLLIPPNEDKISTWIFERDKSYWVCDSVRSSILILFLVCLWNLVLESYKDISTNCRPVTKIYIIISAMLLHSDGKASIAQNILSNIPSSFLHSVINGHIKCAF